MLELKDNNQYINTNKLNRHFVSLAYGRASCKIQNWSRKIRIESCSRMQRIGISNIFLFDELQWKLVSTINP